MKSAVVTGAFGFAGANLVECLLENGYYVYAVGRRKPTSEAGLSSTHNDRFKESDNLRKIYLEMEEYDHISEYVSDDSCCRPDFFFHLAWGGGRDDFEAQHKNVEGALKAICSAKDMGCRRFVGIGSQAEYGVKGIDTVITEDLPLEPFSAYGACKAAVYYLLKNRAASLGIEFIWGRIFSLIGKYEPSGRMLPDLVAKLKVGEQVSLSSCRQYWDYLDASDAARAILLLAEKGRSGEAYNIAHGGYRPLKEYVREAAELIGTDPSLINFGKEAEPFVSLKPSVSKIKTDTGWEPVKSFKDSILCYNR